MAPKGHSLVLLEGIDAKTAVILVAHKLAFELIDLVFLIYAVPNEADKHQANNVECHILSLSYLAAMHRKTSSRYFLRFSRSFAFFFLVTA